MPSRTLRAQLRETADQQGEEVLERRFDAWSRLLATFRAVHGGIQHDRLNLPAYGGSLFDPDRFPFLEGPRRRHPLARGTQADPLPINNRTVLHLLEALQMLQVKVPGGGPAEARRLSFRALDVEQIGHVYEGLLDHTAVRAGEPGAGLGRRRGTRSRRSPCRRWRQSRPRATRELRRDFIAEGDRPAAPRARCAKRCCRREPDAFASLQAPAASPATTTTRSCARVLPFAGLLRDDDFGYPVGHSCRAACT